MSRMIRHSALGAAAELAAPGPVEPVLNIADIQGNILAGFNKDYQSYLFLRIKNQRKARRWVREKLAPRLSSTDEVLAFNRLFRAARAAHGEEFIPVKATWINAGFSRHGIAKLLTDAEAAQFGDEAFGEGLARRSEFLGDPSNPRALGNKAKWKVGGPHNEADIVVIVASDDKFWRATAVTGLLLTLDVGGVEAVYIQHGGTLPDPWRGHEHFGFKDGISQPGIRGRVSAAPTDFLARRWIDPADPRANYFGKPGQLLVWPGEFVLGLPRQEILTTGVDPAPTAANFPAWAQNGSYLVIRRLRQDFSAFWSFVKAKARESGMPAQKFASLLVGRWSSGAPILRSPAADNAVLAADDLANNHFQFNRDTTPVPLVPLPDYPGDGFPQARNDFLGQVCPHFAHIRKVNPRDGATDLGIAQDTATRFVLRRGIPYGASLLGVRNPTPAQLKADRGLVFVAYQASIVDQFETLIRRWTNTPNQPALGGHDPIMGQEEEQGSRRRFIDLPGGPRCFLNNEWVIPTGGGYFFAPSISAVRDVLGAV